MNKAVEAPSKIRLNVNVTPSLFETINKLAVCEGGSKGDVLKKAITLLEVAVKAKENGGRLVIVNDEKGVKKEIEIIGI
jgi:hypothetical protein